MYEHSATNTETAFWKPFSRIMRPRGPHWVHDYRLSTGAERDIIGNDSTENTTSNRKQNNRKKHPDRRAMYCRVFKPSL